MTWAKSYTAQLHELRCVEYPQHRIDAANYLIEKDKQHERIKYLLNCALYDPDPQVRDSVNKLLSGLYGSDLSMMLSVEGSDGIPLEDPWLIPCIAADKSIRTENSSAAIEINQLIAEKDIDGIHQALRDGSDNKNRLLAAKALGQINNSETAELLALSVILDPDDQVQQAAYESLYKVAGAEKAESLLNKFGGEDFELDGDWLLFPEEADLSDESEEENGEYESIFGINKSNYFHGLFSLVQKEQNPATRIKIINKMIETNDIRLNEALAQIYLYDDDKKVKEIAEKELNDRLGAQADEYLEHVRNKSDQEDPESEEVSENEGFIEEPTYSNTKQYPQQPTIQEGSSFNPLVFIAGIVILGLILFLILR